MPRTEHLHSPAQEGGSRANPRPRTPRVRRSPTGSQTATRGPANCCYAGDRANRLWQHHLGHGLVRTPNDFGAQGELPTHPELLDYLAGELIRNGWKLKPIHRLIMSKRGLHAKQPRVMPRPARSDPQNRLSGCMAGPAPGGRGHPRRFAGGERQPDPEPVRAGNSGR